MKTTNKIMAFFFAMACAGAHADLICHEKDSGMDEGYRAIVKPGQGQAKVQQISIAGAKTLGELTCSDPIADPPNCQKPDCVVLICSEPVARDAGYLLYLHQNGDSLSMALSSVSYFGTTDLAFGPCESLD